MINQNMMSFSFILKRTGYHQFLQINLYLNLVCGFIWVNFEFEENKKRLIAEDSLEENAFFQIIVMNL